MRAMAVPMTNLSVIHNKIACVTRDVCDSDIPMPPKLSKRQQRELEELEALKASQIRDASSDEDELTSSVSRYSKGAFSQVPNF